jgi:hypothetical protein
MTRQFIGTKLSKKSAFACFKQDIRPYMAVEPTQGWIHFPATGEDVPTDNGWLFGWNPNLRRWCAANARGNGRSFYTKAQLEAFASTMTAEWNWRYCPVPRHLRR